MNHRDMNREEFNSWIKGLNREELKKFGEELNQDISDAFEASMTDHDFESCDKLMVAYHSYRNGYLALHSEQSANNAI